MLPSEITYKDLQVRLQVLGCCLGDKTALYNEALELGKNCEDKLEKLAYANSLFRTMMEYNTSLILIPEIDGLQEEVAYESQADNNCITIEQADIIFQYLQDYCHDCFREYGYYDTGILPSNDSGGWVGSSGIYVVSRQVQSNWTQTDIDAVDYIKNKSINGYIEAGNNITITGEGTLDDPYVITSSGGGGSGNTGDIRFISSWIKNVDDGNIYISPQDGTTWLTLPSDTQAAAGSYVQLASVDSNSEGIYLTTNNGTSYNNWKFKNDGILEVPGRISFGNINYQSIGVGNVDAHAGYYGVSLYCSVGYELNWQEGYLAARNPNSPYDLRPIYLDSLMEYSSDLSASYTNRSLVDKEYVDNNIPTLQQVTQAGNTTTYGIDVAGLNVTSGNESFQINSTGQIDAIPDTTAPTNKTTITFDTPTGNNQYLIPDKAGATDTFAMLSDIPSSSGGILHGTASGTDTYTVTITGATAYADGDAYLIRFTNGNTTSCTLNINDGTSNLGAVSLYRNNDGPLIGGDIIAGGEMLCVYNSTSNHFQCIGTAPNTLLAYVTNADTVSITKGQAVFISGATGDRVTVERAVNTGDSTSAQTIGIVYSTSIGVNQKGIIIIQGQLDGLNLFPTASWSDGDPIYLDSTLGGLTKTKPYAPNHLVYLGYVVTANNGTSGRMYVKVQNGYELEELHNVQITSTPSDNSVLSYETSSSLYKMKSIGTLLGYTPVPTTRTLTINGTAYDLSADRSWTVTGLPSGTQGDILYHNGTNWVVLNAGTSGKFLRTNGAAANPSWENQSSVYQNLTISTSASSYTPVINGYRETLITCYGLSSATLAINAPSPGSTPLSEGDKLIFRISDNGTLRTLSFDSATSIYIQRGAAVPTSTITTSKISTITFLYNATALKWDCVGYVIEY